MADKTLINLHNDYSSMLSLFGIEDYILVQNILISAYEWAKKYSPQSTQVEQYSNALDWLHLLNKQKEGVLL